MDGSDEPPSLEEDCAIVSDVVEAPALTLAEQHNVLDESSDAPSREWGPMHLTTAERVLVQCAACRIPITAGRLSMTRHTNKEIAVLLNTSVPLFVTLTALCVLVSGAVHMTRSNSHLER